MFTIIADSVKHQSSDSGAITHDVVSGRCSQSSRNLRYATDTPGCQEILAEAIAEFGLGLEYVHDPFNIFMRTGINAQGKNFWEDPFDVKPGDYIDHHRGRLSMPRAFVWSRITPFWCRDLCAVIVST